MIDNSDLGPEVIGRAPASPPAGLIRLKIHDPKSHWEPWMAYDNRIFPHMRAPDGSVCCDVPPEAVRGLLKSGYVIVTE
jgi:hypothetical protein